MTTLRRAKIFSYSLLCTLFAVMSLKLSYFKAEEMRAFLNQFYRSETPEPKESTQERSGVVKTLYIPDGENRKIIRLETPHSRLTISPNLQVHETLDQMEGWFLDEHPRYFTAQKGEYDYKSQLLRAENVSLKLLKHLIYGETPVDPIVHTRAQFVTFDLSKPSPEFEASLFQTSMDGS